MRYYFCFQQALFRTLPCGSVAVVVVVGVVVYASGAACSAAVLWRMAADAS